MIINVKILLGVGIYKASRSACRMGSVDRARKVGQTEGHEEDASD